MEGLGAIPCDTSRLSRSLTKLELKGIFSAKEIDREWSQIEGELSRLGISNKASGVNPGDRRAIFYLIRHLRPKSVLEVGTHVGASTLHIVAALRQSQIEDRATPHRLATVDRIDVNDLEAKPWLKYGSRHSPADMVATIGAADWVRFMTTTSLEYLTSADQTYDFIFLDGDHSARTVYQEIPAALRLLDRGGVILLHDYFPNLRALWSNGVLIPGPWLATERLKSEGARIKVMPLGELPWGTKLNSSVTSLAIVVGEQEGLRPGPIRGS